MSAQPRTIVVGYDGSAGSRRALEVAADLTGYGSSLTVVSVVSNGVEHAVEALAEAHACLARRHVTASYLKPFGEPADELLRATRALDADLLVVGRHGRDVTHVDAAGSVSDAVVHAADCDVLVVGRQPSWRA